MNKLILTLISTLLLCSSCVHEEGVEECEYPLRLHFSYLYNREDRDLLREEVPTITLSLTDAQSGKIVRQKFLTINDLDENNCYEWYVPVGNYNVIGWGGIETLYSHSGDHIDAHQAGIHDLDFTPRREHLWHGLIPNVLLNGDISPLYEMDLRKLSNDLWVIVNAPEGIDLSPISASVTASNGLYNSNGQKIPGQATVYYRPHTHSHYSRSVPASSHESHLTILHISGSDDSMLNVLYGDTPIFEGSLTGLLAQNPDLDFELDDEFEVVIDLAAAAPAGVDDDQDDDPATETNFAVTISVNDWTVTRFNVILR